jgi:hypothetical protein
VEIRLHRTNRLIENRRDFLVTAFFLIVQRHDGPIPRAQFLQRCFHCLSHLRLQLRRPGRGMGKGRRLILFDRRGAPGLLTAAKLVIDYVDDDPIKERRELRFLAEVRQRAEESQEDLLREIFPPAAIACETREIPGVRSNGAKGNNS